MLAVVGFGLLEYGVWQWWEPAAWILAGGLFVLPLTLRIVQRF